MATAADVPGKFDVAIGDRAYMIDTQYLEAYRSQTLDPIRQQGDSSASVGEATLNPEGYWRRSPESFHKGAGQARYDADDSDPARFLLSEGVDIWTKGELSLLRATEEFGTLAITASSTVRDALLRETSSIVLDTLGTIHRTSALDGVSLSTVSSWSGPDGNITAFDLLNNSTGFIVDSLHLYETSNVFTSSLGLWITDDPVIQDVRVSGGRVFAKSGNDLYDISATGLATLPAPLLETRSPNVYCTYTNGYWYFAENDLIYKTTVKADGSGLEVPTVAATLPQGETSGNLFGYLGFVLLGTRLTSGGPFGLRLGVIGSDGSLTLGARFANGLGDSNLPFAFHNGATADGQFIYVTRSNGLTRIDVSVINDALEPAWAHDLAFSLPAACVFGDDGDVYALNKSGTFYRSTANTVSSGYVDVGEISFGTREPKLFLDPVDTPDGGAVGHLLTTPAGVGYTNADVSTPEPAVSWRITLGSTDVSTSMTVKYPILRALPQPAPIDIKTVPLLLHHRISTRHGALHEVDTQAELAYLEGLRTGGLVDYVNGGVTASAQVVGVDWLASERSDDGEWWNGTAVVRLKVLG